jgi:hypothetical protein
VFNTYEGCSSICDSLGNLLFYTNGYNVWDNTNNAISITGGGGTLLLAVTSTVATGRNGANFFAGCSVSYRHSGLQGVIIVPDPGNHDQYYIFTVNDDHCAGSIPYSNGGLRYTIINVQTNEALFDMQDVPNVFPTSGHLTAIPSCNGQDYWIITHGFDPSFATSHHDNRLVAYPVTPAGIGAPVFSTGFDMDATFPTSCAAGTGYYDYSSIIKASPDGKKVAFSNEAFNTVVYSFDKLNGTFANLNGTTGTDFVVTGGRTAIAFSPNSQNLYTDGVGVSGITQYHLGSSTVVTTPPPGILLTDGAGSPVQAGSVMQLGADNKIYSISSGSTQQLDRINFPDAILSGTPGANEIGFTYMVLSVPSSFAASTIYGLPNMVDAVKPVQNECNGKGTGYLMNNSDDALLVYPNPNNGNFTLDFSQNNLTKVISLFDIQGKEVYTATTANSTVQVDASYLEKGMYFLQVNTGSRKQTLKVIVQ